jgi:energy-coupling factor transport system substrate-specific component
VSWEAGIFVVLAVVLVGGFAWYELSKPPARVVSLVATLSALAVVGRIAFAPIPNVKPTTDIVLFAGWALGPVPGFAVGALTGLVSNVFFGQGPWTPWQMAGWGLVGVLGGLVAKLARGREPRRLPLALLCAAAGFGYGALLDLYQTTLTAQHDLASYVAVSGTSFPYNLAHALGNFGFALLIGPAFLRALRRYRRRFEVRWAVVGLTLVALALPAAASAATPKQRALSYLLKSQNADGGFGPAPGQASSPLYTGWAGFGLAAAGLNPRDARHPKLDPIAYTRRHAGSLSDLGEAERTVILLRAAGVSPRNFAGRNLVSQVARAQKPDGSWEDLVDHTAYGVLALRAAGSSTGVRSAVLWLERQQNSDGGFGFGPKGGSSDADDTGSVLQALAAAGKRGSKAVKPAISYLRHAQNADGGFGQRKGDPSNAQSTAWAVQGLVAAGRNPDSVRRNGHTPIGYLVSLQTASGMVRYSRTSAQSPVWVTGEALVALSRRSLPIGPVPLKAPAKVAATPTRAHATDKKAASHSKRRLHGGPVATIAQTTPAAVPPTVPTAKASLRTQPRHRNEGTDLTWILVGIGAAAVLVAAYRARGRLRTLLG